MADVNDHYSGHGGGKGAIRKYRDEGDGSYTEVETANIRGWDATALAWAKVPIDHATGALLTASAAGSGSAVSIADGSDVAEGATTDVAVTGDNAGTVSGKLRGLTKIFTDIWDSANHRIKVDGSGVTQPVSGTVTSNIGTTNGLALDATLTGGTQKAIARGGAKGTTTAADITSNPVDANTQALHVDGSKVTQPISGSVSISGTPTVDTELPAAAALADTTSNPTVPGVGAFAMVWNGTTWDRAPGDKTNGWFVNIKNSVALDVSDRSARLLGRARLTDDTNLSTIKAASTAVAATDTALVVAVSPNADTKVNVDQYGGSAVTLGQKAMASSEPVVIASDQSPVQVTGTVANAATDSGNPEKIGGLATFPAIPTLVATGQRVNAWYDLAGALITRKRAIPTYTAMYRLADATAGIRALSVTLVANTDKQIATIYHPNTSTKRVQVKYVGVMLMDTTAAGLLEFEIQSLSATTAPATGNPAITPGKNDNADAAADSTCLALPTTPGSVLAANSPVGLPWMENLGITGTPSTTAPPPYLPVVSLWDSRYDGDGKDLIIRSAVAEGYAVVARCNNATTVRFTTVIIFTEE